MSIISDLFVLFAKYPTFEGVLDNFRTTQSRSSALKARVEAMPEKSMLPQIIDYVFATSEKNVQKRIADFRGIYLFADYGNVTRDITTLKVKSDEIEIAITIAKPLNLDSVDPVEEVILSDELFTIAIAVQNDINTNKSHLFKISDNRQLTPFFAAELNNSVGWTMLFSLKGTSIL